MIAQRTTLFGLLFAVSAFNLSALPTQQPTVITRTLSSVDTCDLAEQLNGSETPNAACNITQGNLKGKLSIKRVTKTTRQWTDESDTPKVETKPQWEVTLETECTTGCPQGTTTRLANNNVDTLREAMAKVSEQKAIFSKEANRLEKEEREKQELADRQERCEVDKNGKEFTSDDKALSCKVRRVAKMSREEGAEYYQSEIQPKLQQLMTCDPLSGTGSMLSLMPQQTLQGMSNQCVTDRNKAATLINQMNAAGLKNPAIKQANDTMMLFGQYATKMDQMATAARYTTDPQYKQALQQNMQHMQAQLGGYFAQAGLAIPATTMQTYDAGFNQIANQHQQMVANGAVNPIAAGDGRNMRGQVSTQYGGAPQAPAIANAQPQPQLQQNRAVVPQPVTANRAAGTPNIIKPSLGASVR